MSPFMQSLGLKYPIFQGGMAWVANGELAAAVSNAGGLGIIGSGHAPAAIVAKEIASAKALTDKPFGVNVMLLSPHADEVVQVILQAKVAVVTTGAGNPAKYIADFKAAGIKVIPVVPSVGLARIMERVGVDAVIAEGMESGGHIGSMTTLTLIPQVVDAVSIPVIAAGGIGDGRGVAAALMLGATGVQMGTRFLAAKECHIHEKYKAAVLKAKDIDTLVTGAYIGHPARVLKNKMSRQFLVAEKNAALQNDVDFAAVEQLANGSLRRAVETGDDVTGSYMAGQISGLIKTETSCATILQETAAQAQACLQQGRMENYF
ncbi:enoyl-[acyl-carrier-protein] reductase FabK [Loigolactobacillus zhaoyuanensis]|uniref:Probable nitronate monooxygenase n=1 Tax=Loigolactobacillus zhaoyuanensis TaxID=2486017 RepID=A0ABW8UIQ2_9LACO|nr:enoyl-[acyl-carrier-protein] reductase FabK [Loigolactobacillus zhaoyuanensis]